LNAGRQVFERFSNSLGFDRRLIGADIRGSQAFARAGAGGHAAAGSARYRQAFDRILVIRAARPFSGRRDEDVHRWSSAS
jgi:argininosuccinate lyase